MRRREFIAGLAGAVAGLPGISLGARAQQAVKPVIGFLHSESREAYRESVEAFHRGLLVTGYIESRNVAIEYRFAEGKLERLLALAADLVQRRVTVIAASTRAVQPAKLATTTIPIVFASGGDPVRLGLVASLNRPGGNLTGVTLLASDMMPKRLGVLRELIPQSAAIAMLSESVVQNGIAQTNQDFQLQEVRTAARNIGVRIVSVSVASEAELGTAFATIVQEGAGGLVVPASAFFLSLRGRLVALAAQHRLPAIYQTREYAVAGGLMTYGPSLTDAYRQLGVYTGRVLKGEMPADMPIEQPVRFEFVINIKAAKGLGLTIPETLLATADEVIQ